MKKLLITGATGFIGGRLAESAVDRGVPAVALVRRWSSAARLARLPIRMVQGDILEPASVRAAMAGCDAVVHCAVDNRARGADHRAASAEGTRNVMQAALDLGVRRAIHLSSIAVHGYRAAPDAATEEGAYVDAGDDYCEGKKAAELVALRYHREHGVPVTVLRPTIVYGPFGSESVETATLLRRGRMTLVNGGTGICNALYVDNLIDALWLALENDSVAGHVFHISDAEPVTWREFIEPHAHVIDERLLPLPEMTVAEIAAARRRMSNGGGSSIRQALSLIRNPVIRRELRSVPAVKGAARIVRQLSALFPRRATDASTQPRTSETPVGGDSRPGAVGLPSKGKVDIYANEVVFSIDKARRVLGYEPRVAFPEGLEDTLAWVRWARL
jgi:nucleoside-diphosphate-sugar epimerase